LGDTSYSSYTADGLVLSTTNANGHVTTNTYYPCCARLWKQTDPDANVKTFVYDFNGNLVLKQANSDGFGRENP
jgi:uncharacterized protein RhaS with RHS repeats